MGAVARGLLDTSVLIADLGDASVLPDEACISVVSLAELHFGVLRAKDDITRQLRLRRLGAIEATIPAIGIDAAIARAYASVADAVALAGRSPRPRSMDLWIAATALTQNLPLFTRNEDDFKGLTSLVDIRAIDIQR